VWLDRAWFLYPDIIYDEYWFERQDLARDYVQELCLKWTPPCYQKDGNIDICVMVPNLEYQAPHATAITQFVSPIVRSLSEKGYKVHMIDLAPQHNDTYATGFIMSMFASNQQSITTREELLQFYPKEIELHYVYNTTMKNRMQDILDLVCKINPLCILDCSSESATSLSYYYSQSYPNIYIPMKNQGCSSSFFTSMLCMETAKKSFLL
jgi:hypothetical protein